MLSRRLRFSHFHIDNRRTRGIIDAATGLGQHRLHNSGQGKDMPSILQLPLVAPESRLTQQLLPDALTPTPSALVSVDASAPSLLRRSRGVGEGAHFSYTTPLVLPFPYELAAVEDEHAGQQNGNGDHQAAPEKSLESMSVEERQQHGLNKARREMERVERLMRPYEVTVKAVEDSAGTDKGHLLPFLPPARALQSFPSARLLAISGACINDCLPNLDVGDAFDWIKARSGRDGPDCYSSGPMANPPVQGSDAQHARYELSDFLSGRLIGALFPSSLQDDAVEPEAARGVAEAQHLRVTTQSQAQQDRSEDSAARWQRRNTLLSKRRKQKPEEYAGYAPWSNSYSGHQFGQWAGQLGDGRATTLMETRNPRGERWEIQLKGAGRTPYSRFADGLATLASSVREFLASEALAGLGIPTSRALCVTAIDSVPVVRETRTCAAVTARLAPLWVRVGSFEHHAARAEWESLRLLGEFSCREGYQWHDICSEGNDSVSPWAERLVHECVVRNASTIAKWQVYGFMHGVMNTDNISILGITIDFGPFAFMDIFDRNCSSNKSDGEGRYSYNMQPTAGLFVMEQLMQSLAVFIAIERQHGRAVRAGELVAMEKTAVDALGKQGKEAIWSATKSLFMDTLVKEWEEGWRKRLALQTSQPSDRTELIDPLLDIFEGYIDLTTSMRRLGNIVDGLDLSCDVRDSELDKAVSEWIDWDTVPSFVREGRKNDARRWIVTYTDRLKSESQHDSKKVAGVLQNTNPAFILRNWITDELAKNLEVGNDTTQLAQVLLMCLNPFKAWGEQDRPEAVEEKRLCSVGTPLSYHMPSCSS